MMCHHHKIFTNYKSLLMYTNELRTYFILINLNRCFLFEHKLKKEIKKNLNRDQTPYFV